MWCVTQVTDSLVRTKAAQPAAQAVLSIGIPLLSEIAGAFALIGAVFGAAALFAGPAAFFGTFRRRRQTAPERRPGQQTRVGVHTVQRRRFHVLGVG